MTVTTLLLDADGVLQRPSDAARALLRAGLDGGPDPAPPEFLDEVFAAERPALTGGDGFPEALAAVLRRWDVRRPVDALLGAWTDIEVDRSVVEVVRALRADGLTCALASNQQRMRAERMSAGLGYREIFDREFYSCDLGVAKPDARFFEAILDALGAPAASTLFVDDLPENVAAARAVGLRAEVFEPGAPGGARLRRLLGEFGIRPGAGPGRRLR